MVKRLLMLVGAALLAVSHSVWAVSVGDVESGVAAYYSNVFQGRRTASGAVYDKNGLTAAHRTLPFGTLVRLTNSANGKAIELKITDRGPRTPGRIIDVSRRAAKELGFIRAGLTDVELEVLSVP